MMQYYLRFHLSVIVVLNHMWYDQFGSSGSYAVVGFFVISGYVITKVLNERYLSLESGLKKFWINRFLRLYPTYWACSLLGLTLALLAPEVSSNLGVGIDLPSGEYGQARLENYRIDVNWWGIFYLNNFLMIGLQSPLLWTSPITFSPTAWSTNVELYFYFLISFFTAKSYKNTRYFLAISVTFLLCIAGFIVLYEYQDPAYFRLTPSMNFRPLSLFYYSFLGWSFFFALGCFIYYLPKWKPKPIIKYCVLTIVLLLPFYLTKNNPNLFIIMRIVYGIIVATAILIFSDRCDNKHLRFLGSISYPLFLVHWPMAGFISWIFDIKKNSFEMMCLNLPASILVSILLVQYIEKPIEQFRKRYKN